MKKIRGTKTIVVYYLFVAGLWTYFAITGKANSNGDITLGGALYQFALGLIPLLGGIHGLTKAKHWGWAKSFVGRAVLLISIGAICWGIGQMFWSLYYNIINKVNVPYPSFADVGYSLSFPFLALGLVSLSKATGARFSLKKTRGKLAALLITLVAGCAAYYLLIVVARHGVDLEEGGLKLFFDLAYPIGDLLIFLMSLLIYGLSFKYLGGRYKLPTLSILFGLLVLFVGDFTFSYTTTVETYYNGHWVDLVLPTAWMFIVFGVSGFDTKGLVGAKDPTAPSEPITSVTATPAGTPPPPLPADPVAPATENTPPADQASVQAAPGAQIAPTTVTPTAAPEQPVTPAAPAEQVAGPQDASSDAAPSSNQEGEEK